MRSFHKVLLTVSFILFSLIFNANAAQQNISLTRPMLSNEQIIDWATQAAIAINSYGYNNYQQQFQTLSQQYFTPDGWNSYFSSLQNSGNIKRVVEKQLTLSATANGTPSILQQYIMQGHYTWKVQVPLLITYSDIGGTTTQKSFVVTMDIERTSDPQGVGIKQFMMSK